MKTKRTVPSMKIHLLEPYRTALVAEALKEGFIKPVFCDLDTAFQLPDFKTAGTPEFITETLQLAVLSEELSMIWTKASDEVKRQGIPHMEAAGIESLDVIKLVDDIGPAPISIQQYEHASNIDELWKLGKESFDIYQDLILSQIGARGRPIHPSLYLLIRTMRLEGKEEARKILTTVPAQYINDANLYISGDLETYLKFELPIIFTLQEIEMTFSHAADGKFKIAGAPIKSKPTAIVPVGAASRQLWSIVIDRLFEEEIVFPIPKKLTDVMKLRNSEAVKDFRSLLIPFMDSVVQGNSSDFFRLRKEISKSAKAFRRFPITKKLGNWLGIASIPLGIVEPFIGIVGPSIGAGLIGLGLTAIAKKWEKCSSWIYLSEYVNVKDINVAK